MPLSWLHWYLRIHCFSMTRIPFLFFQSECNFRKAMALKARYSWYWILLTTYTSCVTFSTYLAFLSCHFLLCAIWVTCLSLQGWNEIMSISDMSQSRCSIHFVFLAFSPLPLLLPTLFSCANFFQALGCWPFFFLFIHWLLNTCLFSTCHSLTQMHHSFLKALDFPWILTSSSQHRKIQEKKEWWRGNSFTLNGFKSGVLEARTESDHRMENKENKYKSMEEMSKQ